MIVIDVEGTGVDYERHSIVSLGVVDLANPTRQLYVECRIWDGAHVMDEALAVCGFSHEEIIDPHKPSEAELVHAFITWASSMENQTFLGQNVSFDRDFLKAAARRAGHTEWPFAYRTIDTHSLAWMHMVKRGMVPPLAHHHSALNLDAILRYCGIPEEPKPHNALTGAKAHAEVASRLLSDTKLLPDFMQYEIPWL